MAKKVAAAAEIGPKPKISTTQKYKWNIRFLTF
jgi:hypothetical protein